MQEQETSPSGVPWTPFAARWRLVVAFLFLLLTITTSLSPSRIAFYDREHTTSDLELYWAEAERVADGESYYVAAYEELTARGHPTSSLFNWRSPLPMWLVGKLPSFQLARWTLGLLGALLLLLGTALVYREGTWGQGLLCGIFLSGICILCSLDRLFISPILWSSVLVGLSICAYGLERIRLAVVLGIAAIVFRELAMPYCAWMIALAAWRRQSWELVWWALGLLCFGVFYTTHAMNVVEFAGTDQIADTQRWTQGNGLAAVVGYSQNGFLLLFPQWLTAIYLTCALVGFSDWHSWLGLRIAGTTVLFLLTFAVIGRDVNQYWGTLVAPLLCFGAARSPWALYKLMTVAVKSRQL